MADQCFPPTPLGADEQERWLSTSEFRKLARRRGFQFSPAHTTRLIRDGRLPAGKVGQLWYIRHDDAEAFLSPRASRPRPRASVLDRQARRRSQAALCRIAAIRDEEGRR